MLNTQSYASESVWGWCCIAIACMQACATYIRYEFYDAWPLLLPPGTGIDTFLMILQTFEQPSERNTREDPH